MEHERKPLPQLPGGIVATRATRPGGKPVRKSRIDAEAEHVLWQEAQSYWANSNVTANDVYVRVLIALAAINRRRAKTALAPIGFPSRMMVWRWLRRHSDYNHARTRLGARKAHRFDNQPGGRPAAKRVPDETNLGRMLIDCLVVDEFHSAPAGRPCLTVSTDVRSRYLLGFVASFTSPDVQANGPEIETVSDLQQGDQVDEYE